MTGVPEGRVLIVSPHLDDAAFSCAALLDRPQPADVLTVFAGSPDPPQRARWDMVTGFADSAEAMAARLEEERAALGSAARALDLLEAQYLDDERDPADAAAIAAAVDGWLEDGGGGCVALPAGSGRVGSVGRRPRRHPDHLFVRDVLLPLLDEREKATILLYEELPYRWSGRAEAPEHGSWESLELPVDRERKAARNGIYRSQVEHLRVAGKRLDRPACLPAEERYLRPVAA
jgi:hypothetical protein